MTTTQLAELLTENRTKHTVDRLVSEVLKTGLDWDQFIEIFLSTPLPSKWYLTWWLSHYAEVDPEPIESRQMLFWDALIENRHPSIERDFWKLLTRISLNDDLIGNAYNEAMRVIPSQKRAVAVRAYAMEVAFNVAKRYPELIHEVNLVFENLSLEEPASMQSRKRHYLKKLKRFT